MPTQINNEYQYCNSLTQYSRYKTRQVNIGNIPMGGTNPIRIQSMTTTDTMDTIATVEQSIRIFEAGGEYVRITAPSKKEAENLSNIKAELKRRGYNIPLIADIHFTPNAAEIAARIVEKVRVNPGNYADKKKFDIIDFSDKQYNSELERIYQKFAPLVRICKLEGTAMRIGTNHGSLSDRIMSRYGDTPIGMVESALEFVRICEAESYHNIVLSMKASNPQVMVQAYRLLVKKMEEEGMNYPLHLGVTEAGDGEDGRIKSAVGIGTLLEDGLGDTIRVSLTEAPEAEIPVAKKLVERYNTRYPHQPIKTIENYTKNPFAYQKFQTNATDKIGGSNVPIIIADFNNEAVTNPEQLQCIGYHYSTGLDKWNIAEQAADFILLNNQNIPFEIPGTLQVILPYKFWLQNNSNSYSTHPIFEWDEFLNCDKTSNSINFVKINLNRLTTENITYLSQQQNLILVLTTQNKHAMPELRRACFELAENKIHHPIVLQFNYQNLDDENFRLYASTDFGGLLLDGFGDGILVISDNNKKLVNSTAFGILQATRTRISKTEYISCPSCGRTLFDLEETTAMIRSRTHHLKGVKIGIMGCIVNGPGEMADADYGYVGSGIGKITLYKGQEVVKRNIASENAVDELIELIKSYGDWVDIEN